MISAIEALWAKYSAFKSVGTPVLWTGCVSLVPSQAGG
jgi:hypothetical protein